MYCVTARTCLCSVRGVSDCMWTAMNEAMPPASECYIKGWPEQQATRRAASNDWSQAPQAASAADSAVRSRDVCFNPRNCIACAEQ